MLLHVKAVLCVKCDAIKQKSVDALSDRAAEVGQSVLVQSYAAWLWLSCDISWEQFSE